MPKTLILKFHPAPGRSRANAALAAAARELPDTEVVDMQALYPAGQIDIAAEVARLLSAARLVLQFPVQWYSTPPLMKAWADAVLTHMYYIAYETAGRLFEGTPVMLAATAGNVIGSYVAGGANLLPLADLLAPWRATANRCGLAWAQPFFVYEADKMGPAALGLAAQRYAQRLRRWTDERAVPAVAAGGRARW